MTEETLFAEAIELPPEDRGTFLDEKCGDDSELRERIEVLLRSHDTADSFLANSAEEEFDATLDVSVDDPELIEARSAELRKSYAEKKAEESEPPSANIVIESDGKRVMYFGDYELKGEIARGAMGVVYRAEQTSLKRTVAIKMIRSTLLTNDVDVSRFHAEAEAAASLDHPNIVPIYEVGVHEDQHYFSMKLIEGGTLRDRLEQLKNDPQAAAELMSTVAGAIHAAHQRGILHRDLKPGNILIDEQGQPHVTDFGLAKQMESNSSVTLSGQIMGTPQYMAPEQAEGGGKDLTTAADVYALGAIFYEMLCGKPPHQGESLMETLKLVAEDEAAPPSRHNPKVDRDLETIAMKCLEKEPTKRYASAQGLKDDLDHWLAGEPIQARPVGTGEKVVKWMKRKPMHAAAAGLVFVLLLLLGIGGPIKAKKEQDLREEAEIARAEAEASARASRVQAYSADMNVAAHSIEQHRFARAAILLDRHLPKPGEEDLRGFEWRYLREQAHSDDLGTIGEYHGLRGGLAVSPDDSLLVHNTEAGIEVRDRGSGDLIRTLEVEKDVKEDGKPADFAQGVLRFSPDGKHLLSVKALSVHRWKTDTWEEEPRLKGMGWPLVFSGDGSTVVGLSGNRFVVRDARTFEEIRKLKGVYRRAHQKNFNSHATALTPDGAAFFAADNSDGQWIGPGGALVRRWDVTTGEEKPIILPRFQGPICLEVSSKGLLAASNWDGHVALWNTVTESFVEILEPHIAWSPMLAFSSNGRQLATVSADETIAIYDIDDEGRGTLQTRLAGHENEIWALAVAKDGEFYTGSTDGTTRRWRIPRGNGDEMRKIHLLSAIEFEADGDGLIVWSKKRQERQEGFYRLNLQSGELEPLPKLGVPDLDLNFKNSMIGGGGLLAIGNKGEKTDIAIWNLETGEKDRTLSEAGRIEELYRGVPFAFSPDASLFATTNETNGIRLWDCTEWSHRDLVPDFSHRTELRISANNRVLAACPPSKDTEGLAVEIESGRILAKFSVGGLAPELALSSSGRYLAVGSTVREIQLWDLEKGEKIHSLRGHVAGLRGLAFSPDERTLATCGDQRLKLWNVETGSEMMVLARDVVEIGNPRFSPDGKTLVAHARDQWLRVWRVPES